MIKLAQRRAGYTVERTNYMQKDRNSFVVIKRNKDHYTVAETAEILGISKSSVQFYITNGVLNGVTLINGRRMVSKEGICRRLSETGKIFIWDYFNQDSEL